MVTAKQLIIVGMITIPVYHSYALVRRIEGEELHPHIEMEMRSERISDFVLAPVTGSVTGISSSSASSL